MSLYDELQTVAAEVLAEFKQGTISYVEITAGNGPVDNPGPSVPVSFPVDGALRGVKWKYVAGGLAVASDLQLTMAVNPAFIPKISGFIDADGVRYKIVQIISKPSAGTVVAYTLIIRK